MLNLILNALSSKIVIIHLIVYSVQIIVFPHHRLSSFESFSLYRVDLKKYIFIYKVDLHSDIYHGFLFYEEQNYLKGFYESKECLFTHLKDFNFLYDLNEKKKT